MKTILITGGRDGIGKAAALQLAGQGVLSVRGETEHAESWPAGYQASG